MRLFRLILPLLAMAACRSEGTTDYISDRDGDGIFESEDCDDNDPTVGGGETWYADDDLDGHGNPAQGDSFCVRPEGYSPVGDDCNDADATVYPGADDICDGIDQDCDGVIDNGLASTLYYTDADRDGFGNDASAFYACTVPPDSSTVGGDCDDTNAAYNPGAVEADCTDPNDYNCDGSVGFADADEDGWAACEDCDDASASVSPGASETCDGVDNDCDGTSDEAGSTGESTFYADGDADGYGDAAATFVACEAAAGWVADSTDCDDSRADVSPAATEVCNGIDDDCDALVDDDDDSLDGATASIWYGDSDADGYGDTDVVLTACEQPTGTTVPGGDCDDTDPAYNPGAIELDCADPADYNCDGSTGYADDDFDGWAACEECDDTNAANYPGAVESCDGVDNDCDAEVDESDAIDATTWYADADGDTFGDAASSVVACAAPVGYGSDTSDCDDNNASVSPAETEVCNGIDDNCDGVTDEDSASDSSLWYADADGDAYGNAATSVLACAAPAGFVADNADCDDTSASVSPGSTEVCNAIDDDCDGATDEGVTTTYYVDADADTFGSAASPIEDCVLPSGYSENDNDCDDSDPSVYPGAVESYDGTDEDCNGTVDDTRWGGTGADGALSVTGTTTLDGHYAVTAFAGDEVTVDSAAPALAAGDEVLLINMHGDDAAYSHVGNYEFLMVAAVSGSVVTLDSTPTVTFGETSNADLSGQAVQLVRVSQFTDVSVGSAGLLTAPLWDGSTGGVLAFRATGTVVVETGGAISVDALGFAAGETGTCSDCDAFQGESYAGVGDGNLPSSGGYYGNWAAGYYQNNYGGGGAMITGGGGNYGGGATSGASWTGGSYPPSEAGDTYGEPDLSVLFLGSGGAGVWHGSSSPGPGGDGAGIVFVAANEVVASGSGAFSAVGGTTLSWATGTWTYGAGGGAGGSVWLIGDTLTLATNAIDASGGFGEDTHIRIGGDGGYGRVRIDYHHLNGADFGTGPDATSLTDASTPDAGHADTP